MNNINYLVVEMQTYADDTCGSLKEEFNDLALAEQKYHMVLAAAAVSQCKIHSAVLLDFSGRLLKREQYTHEIPEPEPEPEPEEETDE